MHAITGQHAVSDQNTVYQAVLRIAYMLLNCSLNMGILY